MTQHQISDDSPGRALFPEYATIYDLIAQEVEGLTPGTACFLASRLKLVAES